jgi:hypothetical protein
MKFIDAWPGRRIRTAAGEEGTIVSRANGTAYVMLNGGAFHRFVLSELEAQRQEAPPPPRRRRRDCGRLPMRSAAA